MVEKALARISAKSWKQIYQDHVADHAALFDRVSIDLGGAKSAAMPTDERLKKMVEGEADPLFTEQLFQYGRYLMIAGSRPGTQPLILQGIWNGKVNPPWGSKYTININCTPTNPASRAADQVGPKKGFPSIHVFPIGGSRKLSSV